MNGYAAEVYAGHRKDQPVLAKAKRSRLGGGADDSFQKIEKGWEDPFHDAGDKAAS